MELQKQTCLINLSLSSSSTIHGLADLIKLSEVRFLIIKVRPDNNRRPAFCLYPPISHTVYGRGSQATLAHILFYVFTWSSPFCIFMTASLPFSLSKLFYVTPPGSLSGVWSLLSLLLHAYMFLNI